MKLIGIEEHFVTPEIMAEWQRAGLDRIDPSTKFHSGDLLNRLVDLAQCRLRLMDETGLDVQVLSLATPALHDIGAASVALAHGTNNALAAAIARHPDRFQAFATLPITQPQEAARELERCVTELGFKGTMLCGRADTRNLDDPFFTPVLQTAAELAMPVFLHPRIPPAAVREAYYSGFDPELDTLFSTAAIGWHFDAGIQFVRLVMSGAFDRLPNLQVILGHWGELVLFYAERLAVLDRASRLCHPFGTYLRRNLHITASGMFWPQYLQRAAAIVGTDRLMFSTDFPYQYRSGRDARRFIETCGLSGADLAGFAHGNWERLISPPAGQGREADRALAAPTPAGPG